MKGVDLENLMKKNFRSYFFFNFLDEKYQKKMKTIKIDEREYKTNLFQFNEFITDKEIVTKILNEIDRTFEEVLIKGNKIYIPFFRKDEFYKKMDFIFVKHLWNGKRLIKPPKFKTIMIFGNIRIAQKTNIVSSDDKYYLFYKVDEYSFHSPIEKEELEKYKDLEIKEVIMNTKGEDTNKLMDDFEIEEKLNQLKGDI